MICSARGRVDRGQWGAPRSICRPGPRRREPLTRRTRRSRPWFGAVAAVLLLALPVQADDIEPEPYVEEEVAEPEPEPEPEAVAEVEEEAEPEVAEKSERNIEKAIDLVLVRPLYAARWLAGRPFFCSAIMASYSRSTSA